MHENENIQAVVAGHICLDIIPDFNKGENVSLDNVLAPGKLINVGKAKLCTGGAVSNTGIALSILGIKTKLMCKVGKDFFGEGVKRIIEEKNADSGIIEVEGEETSYTVIIAPPGIDRIFLHNPGANDTFCADDINYDIVKEARLFHFGYPPLMKRFYQNDGEELVKMFKKVKELGVTTSLDVALPDPTSEAGKADWRKILTNVLPYVDIFIPSAEEIMYMLQIDAINSSDEGDKKGDPLEDLDLNILQVLGEKLISMGTKIAVVKCGLKGFYIRTAGSDALMSLGKAAPEDLDNWADRELIEETFYVDRVVSAAGAGDNSIAGFLAAFLRGMSIEKSIRIACAVGAQNVKVADTLSGVKTWDETLAMLPGWKKNRNTIRGDYWKYDAQKEVWIGKADKKF
ncbi:MAG TPA: carbohydrate kinase family protein [Clostridiaceae bacterium]|nr:carbohydrate kinase family protein [Clostridiaceae bacterium]